MSKVLLASIAAVVGTVSSATMGQVIYDNQSSLPGSGTLGIVSHPGGMTGAAAGSDRSAIAVPGTLFGIGSAAASAIRLADDFTIPAGETWTITGANVFGYQTGATAPSNTAVTIRILGADPLGLATGAVSVLGGDTTTNVQTSNAFFGPTAIYRTTATDTAGTTRRIQQATTAFGPIVLGPGTYWLDFDTTGIAFVPALTPGGGGPAAVTGNARQVIGAGTYTAGVDAGSTFAIGVPFQIIGTIVPAPSSLALLGLGGLVAARRRRN